MTQDEMVSMAAILLSLACAYIPGLSEKYNGLDSPRKAWVMAGLLAIVAVGVFALTCWQVIDVGVYCNEYGLVGLAKLYVMALIANQSAFSIFVRPFKAGS